MAVEVGVRELRSRLSYWLDRAANGEEVIVTRRRRPRVRLTSVGWEETRRRLIEEGILTPAQAPKVQIDLDDIPEIPGLGLSEILLEQRRSSP